jgi:tRNA(Ile2) C34 agmatinyltransferase TiaS
MSRNPYAKSLRTKPQQVIPDKRDRSLRQFYDEALKEGIKPDEQALLDKLD